MTKYLVSHKSVAIYFDDKRCGVNRNCERQKLIELYLKGLVKLIASVNLNDDWVIFGKHMEIVVESLMNHDDRHERK